MDIYCNKVTKETFIFHSKTIDYKNLDFLEYDPEDYSVDVHMKDGRVLDLGVKIQWLVRPYFANAEIIQIVQTKNREPIDGTFVPLKHKGQNEVFAAILVDVRVNIGLLSKICVI